MRKGDLILPSSRTGKPSWLRRDLNSREMLPGVTADERVFIASDLYVAAYFAYLHSPFSSQNFHRKSVYLVRPIGEVLPDNNQDTFIRYQYHCFVARVLAIIPAEGISRSLQQAQIFASVDPELSSTFFVQAQAEIALKLAELAAIDDNQEASSEYLNLAQVLIRSTERSTIEALPRALAASVAPSRYPRWANSS